MKLTDKRFWSGEKTGYYPSFKYLRQSNALRAYYSYIAQWWSRWGSTQGAI